MRTLMLVLCAVILAGCGRMRFVVDLTSAEDDLDQSVVLEDDRASRTSPKIAMIDITGLIVDARKPGLITPGENPVSDLAEALRKADDDGRVVAVLLRINSPGGTVTASDVMYREVQRFKQSTGKPVVVVMGDLAASGGYYLACAGDHIIAHPTTITGSIGVIIQTFNVAEGLRRIGVRAEAITSGDNKAVGSPFEPMQDEHRAILQGLVDDFYDGFVAVVTERWPGLEDHVLAEVTDGRVITGQRAHELQLVDAVGDLYDGFEAAKSLAGVSTAQMVKYHRPLNHVASPYAATPQANTSQINLLQVNLERGLLDQPGAYYLWDPAAFAD